MFSKLKHFLINLYAFRNLLWEFREWDYGYVLHGMEIMLRRLEHGLQHGIAIHEHDDVAVLWKVIRALRRRDRMAYYDIAERVCGYDTTNLFDDHHWDKHDSGYSVLVDRRTDEQKERDDAYYKLVDELEQRDWNTIFDTMRDYMRTWWD